jgi:hypothetical protein
MSTASSDDTLFAGNVSASDDVLMQELPDQELIFLNLRTESYFALADTGARMYRALLEAPSVERAYQQLQDEFDADPAQLRADLRQFIGTLLDEGLVRLDD